MPFSSKLELVLGLESGLTCSPCSLCFVWQSLWSSVAKLMGPMQLFWVCSWHQSWHFRWTWYRCSNWWCKLRVSWSMLSDACCCSKCLKKSRDPMNRESQPCSEEETSGLKLDLWSLRTYPLSTDLILKLCSEILALRSRAERRLVWSAELVLARVLYALLSAELSKSLKGKSLLTVSILDK